jgi:hypothetical protein
MTPDKERDMIFEMACYRGTQVWLDGEKSATGWTCGTEGDVLTSSNLQIGPHRVEAIKVTGPTGDDTDREIGRFYVFDDALVPEEIEMQTANGTWRGSVTKVVVEELPGQGGTAVTLANGESYEIDETTLYLRGILQPVK